MHERTDAKHQHKRDLNGEETWMEHIHQHFLGCQENDWI